jgi:Putative transposase
MVTFDRPAELRALARRRQPTISGLCFRTSAAALQKLARDRTCVGGQRGCLGVLHTWTRALRHQPHIPDSIAGGGLSADGSQWLPAREDFLVPVNALAKIFRATFRDALKKTPL